MNRKIPFHLSLARHRRWLALAAMVTGILLIAIMPGIQHGFAEHMSVHIVLMGIIAPAIAWCFAPAGFASGTTLITITLAQMALLYGWHSPDVMAWAMASMLRMVVMQVSLLMIATAFWTAVFARYRCSGWQAIVAVLVTGKLFCLLGALLVFSPRPLYAPELVSFADQQLAGLIMLTACPLTYVGVAFAMTLVGLRNLATNRHAAY